MAEAGSHPWNASPLEKINYLKLLAFQWASALRPSETVVILWLMCNTLLRGKVDGCYSLTQFVAGIPRAGANGHWCKGVGLSQRSIQTAIKSLKRRGLITTRAGRRGTIFTVNLQWEPEDRVARPGLAETATIDGNDCHPSKGERGQSGDVTSSPSPSAPARTVPEVVKSVEENRKKKKPPQNRPMGYQQTWNEAWKLGSFRRVAPAFTKKTGGMLAKALKKDWPARFGDQHEFIRWTVLNWNAAVSAKLKWMTKSPPPSTPCPDFLAHFIRYFIDAFMDAETVRWINALPRTQAQIEEKVHQGMDREVAIFEVAKTQVLAAEREALGRKQQDADRTLDLAMMMIARAERATRFTADNPHPRAHENRPLKPIKVIGDGDGSFRVSALPEMVFDEA